MYDVIEVDMDSNKVTGIMAESKTMKNAEAVEKFALMRRGTESNFFAIVPARTHRVGDEYNNEVAQ